MNEGRSLELIRDLARDLEPVRPVPRLRTAMVLVLLLWLLVAAMGVVLLGVRPDLTDSIVSQRGVAAVYAGLGIAGLGGLVAALAMGIPGREFAARLGLATSLLGMALAAGVGTLLFVRRPGTGRLLSLSNDLPCLGVACAVALLPALGVVWFAGRAAPHRPLVLVLAAASGTAALGAVSAHTSCPSSELRHLLMGHVLAPALGALLMTLPLLVALRRSRG